MDIAVQKCSGEVKQTHDFLFILQSLRSLLPEWSRFL